MEQILNYESLFSDIKHEFFSSDLSGLRIFCAIFAAVLALISLVGMYNRIANGKEGAGWDLSSIVSMVAILLFTVNFYTFVMGPLDSMTSLVSKAFLSASYTERSSYEIRLSEVIRESEESLSRNTLLGRLRSMEEDVRETGTDEENLDAEEVAGGELSLLDEKSPSFWERVKGVATKFLGGRGIMVKSFSNIAVYLVSLLSIVVRYIFTVISMVLQIVLGILGPLVFALGVLPSFRRGILTWIATYMQISFWRPTTALIDLVCFKAKDAILGVFDSSSLVDRLVFPSYHLILVDLVSIILLFCVPKICSVVINGGNAESLYSAVKNTAISGFNKMK